MVEVIQGTVRLIFCTDCYVNNNNLQSYWRRESNALDKYVNSRSFTIFIMKYFKTQVVFITHQLSRYGSNFYYSIYYGKSIIKTSSGWDFGT